MCATCIDNEAAAAAAVRHLISIGLFRHRHDRARPAHLLRRARETGDFAAAMRRPDRRAGRNRIRVANFTEQSGYLAMQQILEADARPTAVFAGTTSSPMVRSRP